MGRRGTRAVAAVLLPCSRVDSCSPSGIVQPLELVQSSLGLVVCVCVCACVCSGECRLCFVFVPAWEGLISVGKLTEA